MKKPTNHNQTTKRGNKYGCIRKNKIADGMMRNYTDQKSTRLKPVYENGELIGHQSFRRETTVDVNTLLCYGTLDSLRGHAYLIQRKEVAHPIEPGYTKIVFGLNDVGRTKLKRMRRERQNNFLNQ